MEIEYEVRFLEIDKERIIERLEELGAIKKGDYNQKRYVYNLVPSQEGKWIRLRTNGSITTLTYKDIEKDTVDGTREVEVQVDDFEKTNELLERIGFKNKGYQENKRTQYILNGVEIDIDSWPMIPTYLEIEGKSEEEIIKIQKLLNMDESKKTMLNCKDIYMQIYGIDINKIKELKF